MFDFLRNNTWIITLLVGAFAILSAWAIMYLVNWWRLKKQLRLSLVTTTKLIKDRHFPVEEVLILYKNSKIENIRLFVFEVKNNGKQSIEKKDFDSNLKVIFNDGAEVINTEILCKHPSNLPININCSKNLVEISPILLNRDDSFRFKVLAISCDEDFSIDARIVGIKEIEKIESHTQNEYKLRKILVIVTSITSVLFLLNAALLRLLHEWMPFDWFFNLVVGTLCLLLGMLTAFYFKRGDKAKSTL